MRHLFVATLAGVACLCAVPARAVPTLTLDLKPPVIDGSSARFTVAGSFIPEVNDEVLVSFSIDAEPSTVNSTPITDFSDFEMDIDTNGVGAFDWAVFGGFAFPTPDESVADADNQFDPANSLPGPQFYTLGEIVVDLDNLAGQSLTVAIDGPETRGTYDSQNAIAEPVLIAYQTASQTIPRVPGVGPSPVGIPEPHTAALAALAALAAVGRRQRDARGGDRTFLARPTRAHR